MGTSALLTPPRLRGGRSLGGWSELAGHAPFGHRVLGALLGSIGEHLAVDAVAVDITAPVPRRAVDLVPARRVDRRHRWLMGADVVAEAGFKLSGSVGVFSGVGLEGVFGRTEVYTHGNRVAIVPPLRAVGELGFRASF